MGLFDDNDYDSYRAPPPPSSAANGDQRPNGGMRREAIRREILGRRQEQAAGISKGDVIRHELSIPHWRPRTYLAIVVLLCLVGAILWVKFAHTSIKDDLNDRLGLSAYTGTVTRVSRLNLISVRANGQLHRIHLIGIGSAPACVGPQALARLRQVLRRGSTVAVRFDARLPQTIHGVEQAYLLLGTTNSNINIDLLQAGDTRLVGVTQAAQYNVLSSAQTQARKAHRGLWGCHLSSH
jgi:endonuclease YncB( thermonuclease family)